VLPFLIPPHLCPWGPVENAVGAFWGDAYPEGDLIQRFSPSIPFPWDWPADGVLTVSRRDELEL
jgi:hypothetical protein